MKHDKTTIRVGGVPEHFNLPWHLAIESGAFASRGVDVQWTTYDGGTGQMTRALRNDDIDLCILLTEGIIADIIKGNPSRVISLYVTSPLTWGVHTGVGSDLHHYEDIFDKKYAISRYGSGSHLMPIVDANARGHTLADDQFVVINNLDTALQSLTDGETEVFYWEKFTTKPYVDKGILRRVGEYQTPWPCFVIAATNKILEESPHAVIRVLRTIYDATDEFMQNPHAIDLVSSRYDQRPEDVERWYHRTDWAIHGWVRDKMIDNVVYHLQLADIIDAGVDVPEVIWKR